MKGIRRAWKYSVAASEAILEEDYAWGITRSYLQNDVNRAKGLDPDALEKQIRVNQAGIAWVLTGVPLLLLAKPLKFLVKRKIRKRRNARK